MYPIIYSSVMRKMYLVLILQSKIAKCSLPTEHTWRIYYIDIHELIVVNYFWYSIELALRPILCTYFK